MTERIQTAEERADEARRAAQVAQAKVNALRRVAKRAERKRRAHVLIMMGAELQSLGLNDAAEVGRFIAALRSWTYTDRESGTRKPIINDVLTKARSSGAA